MKKIITLLGLFLLSVNIVCSQEETSTIYLGVFVPEQMEDLNPSQLSKINTKIEQLCSKSGISSGYTLDGFSIYPIFDNDEIFKKYLFYILPFISNYGESKKAIKGRTLNSTSLSNLPIPLPPLEEQKRIVTKIEKLLPLVDKYEEAWTKLEKFNNQFPIDMEKSIFKSAVEGKLTLQNEDDIAINLLNKIRASRNIETEEITGDLPLLPPNWCYCHLGEIVDVKGGKRIPAGRKLITENNGHVYIRVSNMKNNTVKTDNLLYVPEDIYPLISRYTISKEDVYITVAGTIGDSGIIPDELDGANLTENADKLVLYSVNKKWLMYVLKSDFIQKQIKDSTTKVGQPKLAIKRIEQLIIPLAPLEEQERIVAKIDELLPLCRRLK